jgi:hypothetical protein
VWSNHHRQGVVLFPLLVLGNLLPAIKIMPMQLKRGRVWSWS